MFGMRSKQNKGFKNGSIYRVMSAFLANLQRLGKSLMFPIAMLPAAALLNRIGALIIQPSDAASVASVSHDAVRYWIGFIIQTPGSTVFNNLGIIFAMGVGFGLAKDNRGEAALISALGFFILTALLGDQGLAWLFYHNVLRGVSYYDPSGVQHIADLSKLLYVGTADGKTGIPSYSLDTGVLGGITVACFAAFIYNRYKDIKLPVALSFFGGRRFVPMIMLLIIIPIGVFFAAIYPWLQYGLAELGKWLSGDAVKIPGAFLYGVINRILLPFGLHHVLNTFLWFQLPVPNVNPEDAATWHLPNGPTINGDINAFQKGSPLAGNFQSGYFPIFLGGLPGVAAAMIYCARKEKRKQTMVFFAGVAGVAFLTGITEPIEYAFMFTSPLLYGVYALLAGVFCAATIAMNIHIGFGFSAGLIDYIISFPKAWQWSFTDKFYGNYTGHSAYNVTSNPLWIFPLALTAFGTYFGIFSLMIRKMNLKTPGRENDDLPIVSLKTAPAVTDSKSTDDKYTIKAKQFLTAIGDDNIQILENCATRLRLTLKDNTKIDEAAIKAAGAFGIKRLGKQGLQVIVGPDVEHVANEMIKLRENKKDSTKELKKADFPYQLAPENKKAEDKHVEDKHMEEKKTKHKKNSKEKSK